MKKSTDHSSMSKVISEHEVGAASLTKIKRNPRKRSKSSQSIPSIEGMSHPRTESTPSCSQLSPARKLARLMRERPIIQSPTSSATSKTVAKVSKLNMQHNAKHMEGIKRKQFRCKTAHSDLEDSHSRNVETCTKQRKSRKPRVSSDKQHEKVSTGAAGTKSGMAGKNTLKCSTPGNAVGEKHRKSEQHHSGERHHQSLSGGKHEQTDKPRQSAKGSTRSAGKPGKPGKKRPSASEQPSTPGGNIAALLRLGEGDADGHVSASEDSDWEAVEAHCSDLATKGFVEVTLPADGALLKKKKKKGFDMEAYLRREMNAARRQTQVLVHKAHLLCLLSRALQLNSLLNSESMLACAMSMLPSAYSYPPKRVSLSYVEKFLKWFRDKVPLDEAAGGRAQSEDVFRHLESSLRLKKARSSLERVCLFVLIMRAVGVDCRLMLSLQPVPLRPPGVGTDAAAAPKHKPSAAQKATPAAMRESKVVVKREVKTEKTSQKSRKAGGKSASAKVSRRASVAEAADADRDRRRAPRREANRHRSTPASSSSDEFEPTPTPTRAGRRVRDEPGDSGGAGGGRPAGTTADHWAEVYVEEELRWISVNVTGGGVHCTALIRKSATSPLTYVVGCDNSGHLKDLTARYDPNWHITTRKLRVEPEWWEDAIGDWKAGTSRRDKEEDEDLERDLLARPMPQSIAGYKDHPLYALERHLLKFEVIFPPSAVPLGYVGKGSQRVPVYSRHCVHTTHSRETWLKQARVVRPDQQPYKIVKARPKWDRTLQKMITDQPLEVFGRWQTAEYVPPTARDGVVPRNNYGNVELFKPSMLPGGTVHLQVDGLSRVAKKLGIDCAPAMVGWDFHCGGSHPVFQGSVVCAEYADTLMAAWEEDQRETQRRQRERREKRVLDNWRRLIRALRIRQRLAAKYSFESEPAAQKRAAPLQPPAPAKKARPGDAAASRRRQPQEANEQTSQTTKAASKPTQKGALEAAMERQLGLKVEPMMAPMMVPKLVPNLAPKLESKVDDVPAAATKEEEARMVEASIAGMTFARLALSSESEADSDWEVAPVPPPPAAREPAVQRPAARRRGGAAAKVGKRRRAAARAAGSDNDAEPAPSAAASTRPAARRRSQRVDYSEAAGSDAEAPAREGDSSSDEEQPFVKASRRPASPDSEDDFDV